MKQTRFCERCRKPIPPQRVDVLPDTLVCKPCSIAIGGEFEYRMSVENLAKQNSLRKNYGSVTCRKRRKRIQPEQS